MLFFFTISSKSDVYISVVSFHHNIAAKGKYIAHVSCNVETKDPHAELIPGLRVLGKIDKEYVTELNQVVRF